MEAEAGAAPTGGRIKRVALAALMALVAMNVWIGGPLLALWIGSRLQVSSGQSLTIRPSTALAVFGSLAVITVALLKLLSVISSAYDRSAGTEPERKRRDSWLSVERRRRPGEGASLHVLEKILVVVVAIAALTFEIWFFFFSTSPIDQRSGRGAVPLTRYDDAHVRQHPLLAALQEAQADRDRAE